MHFAAFINCSRTVCCKEKLYKFNTVLHRVHIGYLWILENNAEVNSVSQNVNFSGNVWQNMHRLHMTYWRVLSWHICVVAGGAGCNNGVETLK